MRRICQCLVVVGVLGLGTANLSAGTSFSKGDVKGIWNLIPATGTSPGGLTPCTDYKGNSSTCGYKYTTNDPNHFYYFLNPSGNGSSSFVGWHNYTGSGASSYLHSLVLCTNASCTTNHLGFSLTGNASLNRNTGAAVNQFRNPFNDAGYFLSAAGSGKISDSITISAPSGKHFSAFDFYWGSVDPWNSVMFNPSGGTCDMTNVCTTVYGTDLGFNITDLNHTSTTGNQNSATIEFTPYCTTGQKPVCKPNWTSITFNACSDPSGTLKGACYPAFEFDNLQFKLSSNVIGGATSSPTPEPSSMLLLGSGIGSISILLRRRLRRDGPGGRAAAS